MLRVMHYILNFITANGLLIVLLFSIVFFIIFEISFFDFGTL